MCAHLRVIRQVTFKNIAGKPSSPVRNVRTYITLKNKRIHQKKDNDNGAFKAKIAYRRCTSVSKYNNKMTKVKTCPI